MSTLQITIRSTRGSSPKRATAVGDRIVRLVLDHGPDGHADCLQRAFRILELGEQVRIHAGARLVARIEVVAPGFDDVVGRRADVGDVGLAEEAEHAVDQAAHRVHRPAVRAALGGARVVGAEELEGGVHEMELHDGTDGSRRGR